MSLTINPSLAGAIAQEPTTLVLTPGTVIDAQVVAQLADNALRIAIAGLALDVISEVPLAVGQAVTLAVSQTEQGAVRLALVDSPNPVVVDVGTGNAAPEALPGAPRSLGDGDAPAAAASVRITAEARPEAVKSQTIAGLQADAVARAVQFAAPKQRGLAPLFADLSAALTTDRLPPAAQRAAIALLALRPPLDGELSASEVKTAVSQSGLFLEASLGVRPAVATGTPDLKAALLVLRQALTSLLPATLAGQALSAPATAPLSAGPAPSTASPFPPTTASPQPATSPPAATPPGGAPDQIITPSPKALDAATTKAPDLTASIAGATRDVIARDTTAAALRAILALRVDDAIPQRASETVRASPAPRTPDQTIPRADAPPPLKGALPSAQPVASPSIAPDAPVETTLRHLVDEADGALARQTLLQVASLPDRVDAAGARLDPANARWALEIPFATPQGTAVAQFEISRDGSGQGAERAAPIWRARFSLDVEPAGPVHALISFSGVKTSVLMWAERPATAAQLRARTPELSRAFANAQLEAGEIAVRDGAPPQPASTRTGHFLDRAS